MPATATPAFVRDKYDGTTRSMFCVGDVNSKSWTMSNELYLEFHIAYADKKDKEVKKKTKAGGGGWHGGASQLLFYCSKWSMIQKDL